MEVIRPVQLSATAASHAIENDIPTTVNIELEEYAHHMIARLVSKYPKRPSSGMTIPNIDTRTRGRRQYPRTEADRGKVREDPRCEPRGWPWSPGAASAALIGGDMSDRI